VISLRLKLKRGLNALLKHVGFKVFFAQIYEVFECQEFRYVGFWVSALSAQFMVF
jgi:hypothetical protein